MVINTGDVRYLLILDDYDELPEYDIQELTNVWYDIYNDFSEAVGDNRSDLWLLKQKKSIAMEYRLNVGAHILNIVKMLPCDETVEVARENGFEIDLDHFDESFEKARASLVRMQNKLRFEKADKESRPEEKTDFDSMIVTLERFQGYQFDDRRMTVRQFANIYKHYKEHGKN